MRCVCKECDFQVWKGYGEIGFGCKCGYSWLPEKYYAALDGKGRFNFSAFSTHLNTTKGTASKHACPQCSNTLFDKNLDQRTLTHCENCKGVLFNLTQSQTFFEYYKLPNYDNRALYMLSDLPFIALLFS